MLQDDQAARRPRIMSAPGTAVCIDETCVCVCVCVFEDICIGYFKLLLQSFVGF